MDLPSAASRLAMPAMRAVPDSLARPTLPVSDRERLGLLAAPQCRPDPGDQLGRREGLDEVVDRPRLEGLRHDLVTAVAGDEDDGHIGELGDLPHQLNAVGVGQHQVEQPPAPASRSG